MHKLTISSYSETNRLLKGIHSDINNGMKHSIFMSNNHDDMHNAVEYLQSINLETDLTIVPEPSPYRLMLIVKLPNPAQVKLVVDTTIPLPEPIPTTTKKKKSARVIIPDNDIPPWEQ